MSNGNNGVHELEILEKILEKLERIDGRLIAIETRQTLTECAFQRQGQVIEQINTRCMNKLSMVCLNQITESTGDE